MLKQSAMLEIIKDDRVYQFHLPATAALGEVHDVLFQMRSYVVDRINDAQKSDAPKVQDVAVDQEQPKE